MIQRGRNSKYPEKIETWKDGEVVPEWLSDRARVELVDLGSGKKILKINRLSNEGIEVIAADGSSSLVKTSSKDDFVCFGNNRVFCLTKEQVELLYKEEKERGN